MNDAKIITIDGPSGSGKGTISLMLAGELGFHYLDSGAIYRVLAFAITDNNIKTNEIEKIISLAKNIDIEFKVNKDLFCEIYLNTKNITQAIRTEECGKIASIIASIPQVRHELIAMQRDFAKEPGLVTDGRDMGTTIFPNANIKIFLSASIEERAHRRYLQLKNMQNDVSLAEVLRQLAERDKRDSERDCSPLLPAEDAIVVDTTSLNIVQTFGNVLKLANERLGL